MASISVIMLTYNRQMFVSRMIESILAQTFQDFEFIIVDNGSTDRSGVIADGYAARDDRIRVIHRERGNISSGRNAGLNEARANYVAFVDDDDGCEPDYLAFLYALAEDSAADIAICSVAGKAFQERKVMSAEEAEIELLWRRHYNVGFPTKLIRRALFNENRFNEQANYDDIYLMPKIIANAKRVVYHGLPKYTPSRHNSNHSAWTTNHSLITPDILDEYLSVYRDRTVFLCGQFPNNAMLWYYFRWSFMISMVEKIVRLGLLGCERQLKAMKRELLTCRSDFANCTYAQEFELEWLDKYI